MTVTVTTVYNQITVNSDRERQELETMAKQNETPKKTETAVETDPNKVLFTATFKGKIAAQNVIGKVGQPILGNKERWFPKGTLHSFAAAKDGNVTVVLERARLTYRVQDDSGNIPAGWEPYKG